MDDTDAASAETTYGERELRSAAAVEASLDCVVTADEGGVITGVNAAFERTFGHRRADVIGRRLADVILPPGRRDPHGDGFARSVATEWELVLGRRVEVRVLRAGGSEFDAELAITRATAAGSGFLVVTLRDVTDRKRAEEELRRKAWDELRRSEAYLAEGQRLSHTGSWAWKLPGGEIYFSREMFRIYGLDPADGPPPYEAVLARAHPDDAPGVHDALQEAFRSGTELRLLTRICVPGQPMKWVETYGHPVRDERGTLVEFIGTVVEVTERVRAHRRLRRAIRARYQAVLAERTRIARDMHDGLLQDVTGIALQLRALLPHVRTSPDAAAEKLARILEQTERTGREARRAVVGMRADDTRAGAEVGDVVRAVEGAAQRAVARGALALAVTVSGRARPVRAELCDAAAAIVHEAVTNVVRHADARIVRLRLSFGVTRLCLSVRDDGRGLPLSADAGRDVVPGHFGIVGMRERAAVVGASLSVRSVAGGGTLVRLDVPHPR